MLALVLAARVLIGDPLPELELTPLEGEGPVTLPADVHGHPIVIDFFATWCQPCREALPALERLRARFEPAHVEFITISIDAPSARAEVERFVREHKLQSRVLLDPKRAAFDRMGVRKLPTTYIVDPEGVVRRINNGYGSGYEARMARWLKKLMGPAQ
ncbi:MAG TPA: TlpA disulfide reductase family protein [Polyangia bacterium]|nr:TlpA disulfide reductase family protein [Polyangia bacterium]